MGIAGLTSRWGKNRVRTPVLNPPISSRTTHAQDGSGKTPTPCPWAKSTVQQNTIDQSVAFRIAPKNVGLSFIPYFFPRQYISAEAGTRDMALYATNSNMTVLVRHHQFRYIVRLPDFEKQNELVFKDCRVPGDPMAGDRS